MVRVFLNTLVASWCWRKRAVRNRFGGKTWFCLSGTYILINLQIVQSLKNMYSKVLTQVSKITEQTTVQCSVVESICAVEIQILVGL